jgi:hypothetical protein
MISTPYSNTELYELTIDNYNISYDSFGFELYKRHNEHEICKKYWFAINFPSTPSILKKLKLIFYPVLSEKKDYFHIRTIKIRNTNNSKLLILRGKLGCLPLDIMYINAPIHIVETIYATNKRFNQIVDFFNTEENQNDNKHR